MIQKTIYNSPFTRWLQSHISGLALLCVFSQVFISFTGAIVRVTASGLGCPTWPQCFPGSYTPVLRSEVPLWHQLVEFSNRQLAVWIVIISSVAILLAVISAQKNRKILFLAWCMPLGTVVQAILGGITVLTGLEWWSVMLHMLLSLLMVWLSALLYAGISESPAMLIPSHKLRVCLGVTTLFLALSTLTGTLTTSAGPLAGDQSASHPVQRLHYPIINLLGFHTFCVAIYTILVLVIFFYGYQQEKYEQRYHELNTWPTYLLIATGVQILLGITQTVLGLPGYIVVFHVLGACINVALLGYFLARTKLNEI